jgi:hypothetical protein
MTEATSQRPTPKPASKIAIAVGIVAGTLLAGFGRPLWAEIGRLSEAGSWWWTLIPAGLVIAAVVQGWWYRRAHLRAVAAWEAANTSAFKPNHD